MMPPNLISASFDLPGPPKLIVSCPYPQTTCATLRQNWFVLFQNIVFTSLKFDNEQADELTGNKHYAYSHCWRHKKLESVGYLIVITTCVHLSRNGIGFNGL